MRILLAMFFSSFCVLSYAQVFNFYSSEYYLSPGSSSEVGTVLTPSGADLSSFNFSNADPSHPIFTNGLYYPVTDCGGRNLWIRLQHIASDPNGIENGFNIAQTLNSPFLPIGSTDRIGGWAGFLYDFIIFSDENLTGTRANVLNGEFTTNVTVESLETLYNDGGSLYEWLSFEILNNSTTGWSLNSTNFTGINPFSNPGFSSELNYSTTATLTSPPTGFTTDFPTGSSAVYAIDLNLSSGYHSEFRMTASNVGHFRYGYEFTIGGYQGMSMSFGGGPVIGEIVTTRVCNDVNGNIEVFADGYPPLTYEWGNDATGSVLENVMPGTYSLLITDGAGCSLNQNISLNPSIPIEGYLTIDTDGEFPYLEVIAEGGNGALSYVWNDGSTGATYTATTPGEYTVTITDEYGCIILLGFNYVGLSEHDDKTFRLFPNPTENLFSIAGNLVGMVEIFDMNGKFIKQVNSTRANTSISVDDLDAGIYVVRVGNSSQMLLVK